MHESSLGPIAELRHATRSPISLTVGATFGGAAPLINYFTVHLGNLVSFDGELHFRGSLLWLLVAGSFLLSSKSVFCWGRNIFGEIWSAMAMVAMLEGALILAPHWAIGRSALLFLVALNAARYGSALALRDQSDKLMEAAAAGAAVTVAVAAAAEPAVSSSAPKANLPVALANPPAQKLRALPALVSPARSEAARVLAGQQFAQSSATEESTLMAADSGTEGELGEVRTPAYERALALVQSGRGPVSISRVKRECRVGWSTAAKLVAQLEREGVVSAPERAPLRALQADGRPSTDGGALPTQLRLQGGA